MVARGGGGGRVTSRPGYGYSYDWPLAASQPARITTSPQELLQITGAFLVLTVDFVLILYEGGIAYGGPGILGALPLWLAIATAAAASLTAFVAHEMAHKISAQRGGYWAEFRWAPLWLALSVVTSLLGFLFAAPGATVVGGMGNPKDWSRTSLAGPATNLAFAAIFYGSSIAAYHVGSSLFYPLLVIAFFNGWFGAFNLIPFGPLDGAKVLRWRTSTWVAAFALGVVAGGLCYVSLFFYGHPLA
jgi:Zn-dependent protease